MLSFLWICLLLFSIRVSCTNNCNLPMDILFLIDNTFSMQGSVDMVKSIINNISTFHSKPENVKVGVITFNLINPPCFPHVKNYCARIESTLQSIDKKSLNRTLNSISFNHASLTTSRPELLRALLLAATEINWRSETKNFIGGRFVYIFTDSLPITTSKDYNANYRQLFQKKKKTTFDCDTSFPPTIGDVDSKIADQNLVLTTIFTGHKHVIPPYTETLTRISKNHQLVLIPSKFDYGDHLSKIHTCPEENPSKYFSHIKKVVENINIEVIAFAERRIRNRPHQSNVQPKKLQKPIKKPEPTTPKFLEAPEPTTPKPIKEIEPTTPKPIKELEPTTPKPIKELEPTTPKFIEAPEPLTPKFIEAPEPTTPKFIEAPEPTTPKFIEAPEPTTPKFIEAPEPTTPKYIEASEPTTPKYIEASEPTTLEPIKNFKSITSTPITTIRPTSLDHLILDKQANNINSEIGSESTEKETVLEPEANKDEDNPYKNVPYITAASGAVLSVAGGVGVFLYKHFKPNLGVKSIEFEEVCNDEIQLNVDRDQAAEMNETEYK